MKRTYRPHTQPQRSRSHSSEAGATLIEYAIALAALTVVFITGAALLQEAAEFAGNRSSSVVHDTVPCISTGGAYVAGDQCVQSSECFTGEGTCGCCYP